MASNTLKLIPQPDGELYLVAEDYEVYVECKNYKGNIIVPAGFRTDLASVPKALWILIPNSGKHTFAAVVHDYLYVNNKKSINGIFDFSRSDCDEIFYNKMRYYQVEKMKAKTMWLAVRAFGWKFYKK